MKKFLSLLLTAVLCCSLGITAFAAESDYTFTVQAEGSPAVGDTITVTLELSKNGAEEFDLYAMQDYVRFDPAYFSYVDQSLKVYTVKTGELERKIFSASPLDFDEDTGKPKRLDISTHIYGSAPQEDTRLDLWYPDSKRKMECVAAYSSLYPLIIYYLNRLNDWGLYFRKCKICGKVFLAKSQRYELCSDKCRKKQSLQNKREFDERARENNYDLLYKNECQNWRNKINKAKKTPGFPVDRLEEMLAAFESFKKEALQRKQAVKKKTASPKEFSDWLLRQSNIIVELAELEY